MPHGTPSFPAVDLVIRPVAALAARPAAMTLLDDRERARLGRLRHPADRQRFLAGRLLVRELVADVTGVAPDRVRLAVDRRGRVRVAAPEAAPDISISHAGGIVVVALLWAGRVGVDVEPLLPRGQATDRRWSDLDRDALTPEERRSIAGLDERSRADRALRAWTEKEAYAKLVGHGLCLDFRRLSLGAIAARPRVATRSLLLALGDQTYRCAVAARTQEPVGSDSGLRVNASLARPIAADVLAA